MINIELFIVENGIEHTFDRIIYQNNEIKLESENTWFLCYPNEIDEFINTSFDAQYKSDNIDNINGYCDLFLFDEDIDEIIDVNAIASLMDTW